MPFPKKIACRFPLLIYAHFQTEVLAMRGLQM